MRGLILLSAIPLVAQTSGPELFEKSVRPLFAAKCHACHGAKSQMAGLNLATGSGLRENDLVIPGNASQSRLYIALTYADKIKMPPSGKLGANELAAVKQWIDLGAPFPEPAALSSVRAPGKVTEDDRKHWAFQPIGSPVPPRVRKADWIRNPIDRFILAKLENKGLNPAPPASRLALLRRVTLDLTGLPPSPEQARAFLADESPEALPKVVDRLLASPAYGERWGRHWLDVARYADSTGMDEDNLYPHAWRYRDYVVDAFRRDLPYDRFVVEQLAGDLIPGLTGQERAQAITATGFLALGPRPLAQQDRLQMVYDVVDEQIDTTSKAFLGLTIACARCHDHKFDPILTADYYSLASIFAATTSFRNHGRPGSISYMHYTPLDRAAYDRYQTHRIRMYAKELEMEDALSEHLNRENAAIRPKVGNFLTAAWLVLRKGADSGSTADARELDARRLAQWVQWLAAADQKALAGHLKNWSGANESTIEKVAAEYQQAYSESASKWDDLLERWRLRMAREILQDRNLPDRPKPDATGNEFFMAATFNGGPMELPESPRVRLLRAEWQLLKKTLPEMPAVVTAVEDGPAIQQHVFLRGDHHNPGEPVEKRFPVVLAGERQRKIEKGSGRLELANWIASANNPLTARVMVNRIWQWHFGYGLVRTPNNWGTTGEPPSHPELLDYLARQFIESGWSVKSMHRLMVLSNTYAMSTRASKEAQDADPANVLWSRFNRVRMSVEQIRDSLLALDGTLDRKSGGSLIPTGPGNRPRIDPDEIRRRTLYIPVKRGSIPNLFAAFDFGDATTSSEGRPRTNVAPQALFMMNSRFVVERARGLAQRLLSDASATDEQRVENGYLATLTRFPQPSEKDDALSYITELERRLGTSEARSTAWQSFCHVLMSANEFLYID